MKPDKITQAIHDARDEDAETIIKVCEKKFLQNIKHKTGYMDTIMELLPELTLKELRYLLFSVEVMIDKTIQEGEDEHW